MFYIWTVSIGVPSYMLWIPAQVFLWLDHAKTGTLSCWRVLLRVNRCMLTDHQLRCRVTRSFPKVTCRTCCVATISLSANKVHADIKKWESLGETMHSEGLCQTSCSGHSISSCWVRNDSLHRPRNCQSGDRFQEYACGQQDAFGLRTVQRIPTILVRPTQKLRYLGTCRCT
jgi:hypothetical protein